MRMVYEAGDRVQVIDPHVWRLEPGAPRSRPLFPAPIGLTGTVLDGPDDCGDIPVEWDEREGDLRDYSALIHPDCIVPVEDAGDSRPESTGRVAVFGEALREVVAAVEGAGIYRQSDRAFATALSHGLAYVLGDD